jgi:hypothetical protein
VAPGLVNVIKQRVVSLPHQLITELASCTTAPFFLLRDDQDRAVDLGNENTRDKKKDLRQCHVNEN